MTIRLVLGSTWNLQALYGALVMNEPHGMFLVNSSMVGLVTRQDQLGPDSACLSTSRCLYMSLLGALWMAMALWDINGASIGATC